MSLHKRLLVYLLVAAPAAWLLALLLSINATEHEVNELFDTQMIHLAREVQASVLQLGEGPAAASSATMPNNSPNASDADLKDIAIAAWDGTGRHLLVDAGSVVMPYRADVSGFVDITLSGVPWRMYYLQAPEATLVVAAGQQLGERHELVWNLLMSQILPWLLVLPLLAWAMSLAIRMALAPVRSLTHNLNQRPADDFHALPLLAQPQELQPLLQAMNHLFGRVESLLQRERRFTADAAHELRTPLAVVRAQWEVLQGAKDTNDQAQAREQLDKGFDRMERLVTQMLQMSRLDATERLPHQHRLDWSQALEQAVCDVLPLSDQRQVDMACEWVDTPELALPIVGDPVLMGVLVRNLLDNAVRYAEANTVVEIELSQEALVITNRVGGHAAERVAHWGERFHRPPGIEATGSGLGASIVQRVAQLHGLLVQVQTPDAQRVSVRVTKA
jgi:two-component system, OmpR family, sensor histidine kinase QseC